MPETLLRVPDTGIGLEGGEKLREWLINWERSESCKERVSRVEDPFDRVVCLLCLMGLRKRGPIEMDVFVVKA